MLILYNNLCKKVNNLFFLCNGCSTMPPQNQNL